MYFGVLASDVYISESRIVVRSPGRAIPGVFGQILKSAGFANAGEEVDAIRTFILSRDAVRSLEQARLGRTAFTRPQASFFDRFAPMGLNDGFESLYRYYQKKVSVEYDSTTAIAVIRVQAFTPEDAQAINRHLLQSSENLVNAMNLRGRDDLLGNAEQEVADASALARQNSNRLAAFRKRSGVIDPEKQADVQVNLVSKLQAELIASETQLRQLQGIAPENPQIPSLKARIDQFRKQIDMTARGVAGSQRSLSSNAVQYSQLQLDQKIAQQRLANAYDALASYRTELLRKQAYVEEIAAPNRPDSAVEPRRLRGIVLTLFIGLVAFGILSMLLRSVLEHRD
jgi:capsular polysaccharide transport system permease protein